MKHLLTFLFCLFALVSLSQDESKCEIFRKGFFEFRGEFDGVMIYRNSKHQIEYNVNNNEWVTIELVWENPCKYRFKYLATNMIGLKPFIGTSMTVDMLQANEQSYLYQAMDSQNPSEVYKGTIGIADDLDKDKKRLIKKKLKESLRNLD